MSYVHIVSPLDVHRMVAHPEGAPPWSEGHPAVASTGVGHSDGMDIQMVSVDGLVQLKYVEIIGIILFQRRN